MRVLKAFCWMLCFLLAGALIALAAWHGRLQHAGTHGAIAFYLLLAVALAIPARFLSLAGAYLVELLLVGWPRSSLRMLWRPSASVRMDMVTIVMQLLLPQRYLGYALSFGLLYVIDLGTRHLQHLSATPLLPTWGLQVLCVLLFQSFLRYWMHRLEHVIPAFWALHKFHHSAESLSLLTSARSTELARGIEAGLVFAPAAFLTDATAPVPSLHSPMFAIAVVYFIYSTFVGINGYFVHSNLTTDYGWIGRWLIVSPRMHRLHHARSPSYHDRNFTFDLVIWDRLFGTYAACAPDTDPRTIPLGLEDNPFNAHDTVGGALREYFLGTYLVFFQELRNGLCAWIPARQVRERRIARFIGSS
ncbi:MAG TPA: sterol desaturase family protein [Steroidobacteraceae bacterium]|nr:sterol desaturase family protein [Steroidobacteraceae bacterium]